LFGISAVGAVGGKDGGGAHLHATLTLFNNKCITYWLSPRSSYFMFVKCQLQLHFPMKEQTAKQSTHNTVINVCDKWDQNVAPTCRDVLRERRASQSSTPAADEQVHGCRSLAMSETLALRKHTSSTASSAFCVNIWH